MTAKNPNYANQDATNAGTDQAKQSVGEVADQTKQAASQVSGQAKQAATSQLATRKDQTANGLSVVSSAVRDMGDKLRQNDQTSSYAGFADQAAHQLERMSGYLRSRDVRQIAGEAEDWARRDPAIALGGAFVLGLLAARFLKSSGIQKRASGRQGMPYNPGYNQGFNPAYRRGYEPAYRYNDQYYQYGQDGGPRNDQNYGTTYRPSSQYWDDQYNTSDTRSREPR